MPSPNYAQIEEKTLADRICEWARMDVRELAHEWDVLESEFYMAVRKIPSDPLVSVRARRLREQCDSHRALVEHIAIFLHGEDEWSEALG